MFNIMWLQAKVYRKYLTKTFYMLLSSTCYDRHWFIVVDQRVKKQVGFPFHKCIKIMGTFCVFMQVTIFLYKDTYNDGKLKFNIFMLFEVYLGCLSKLVLVFSSMHLHLLV